MNIPATEIQPGSPEERKGLALSALIIGLVALFCAFIAGWRIFAVISGVLAIGVAVFCIAKARKPGARARLALWALGAGILAILVAAYFWLTAVPAGVSEPAGNTEAVIGPAEPEPGVLDKLNAVTDSARSEGPETPE